MNIYDFLDAWGLTESPMKIRKFTRREVEQFMEDAETLYLSPPQPRLGSSSPGIYDGLSALGGSERKIEALSHMFLLSNKVWLPDPVFGLASPSAAEVWDHLPESGSTFIIKTLGIHSHWKPLPRVVASERKSVVREMLYSHIGTLLRLRKLHEMDAVGFYSWERLVLPELKLFPDTIGILNKSGVLNVVTTRFDQDKYALGARLGAIGIMMSMDSPQNGVKAGTKMHFVDKTHILVYGLLNSIVTASLSCRFEPMLPGDRIVYDFIRSNGQFNDSSIQESFTVSIPSLMNAVFEDLPAIRCDSELLAVFRGLLEEIACCDTPPSAECIRGELLEVARKMREDDSLRKAMGPAYTDLLLGLLGGVVGMAITGGTLTGIAAGILSGPLTSFIGKLALSAFGGEARDTRLKNELVTRIAGRM